MPPAPCPLPPGHLLRAQALGVVQNPVVLYSPSTSTLFVFGDVSTVEVAVTHCMHVPCVCEWSRRRHGMHAAVTASWDKCSGRGMRHWH